jgi:hypothetical protein
MQKDPDLRAERDDAPPPRPDRTIGVVLALAAVLVVGVVATWLWSTRTQPRPTPPPVAAPQAPEPAPAAAAASAPGGQVLYPVPPGDLPLEAHEIPAALSGLLGSKAAATFLLADDFPRRLVATVDSLAREHSPPLAWPLLPTPGRFLVEERPDGPVIAPENAARYTPLVLLAGTIDVPAAAALYRRMYPLLQQAYRALGFGERHLNDRVVEVIDVLLATPDAPESPRVQLLPVRGPVPSQQPWLRWQFADPALESLAAGQKILVRVGPVNQRRLKAKLAEMREELVAPSSAAPALAASAPAAPAAPASAASAASATSAASAAATAASAVSPAPAARARAARSAASTRQR